MRFDNSYSQTLNKYFNFPLLKLPLDGDDNDNVIY